MWLGYNVGQGSGRYDPPRYDYTGLSFVGVQMAADMYISQFFFLSK